MEARWHVGGSFGNMDEREIGRRCLIDNLGTIDRSLVITHQCFAVASSRIIK